MKWALLNSIAFALLLGALIAAPVFLSAFFGDIP